MKEHWDPKRSPSVNMANLGLKSNLDDKTTSASTNSTSLESPSLCKAIELFDIPDSDAFAKSSNPGRLPVSIENQKYIVALLAKYGNDYISMSRDIKLNNMQHNENQLRKIGARFLLLNENQIRVEIPDDVKSSMACFSK
jgi:Ribosome biogenesis protein Nop16.